MSQKPSGYAEFHCIAILENAVTVPDKPQTLLFDVLFYGIPGKVGATTVGRFRYYNSKNLSFDEDGEECEITGRIAPAQGVEEILSDVYGEDDVKIIGDIYTINRTPGANVLENRPRARFTITGLVDNVFKSTGSFTLNIWQYVSVYGSRGKAFVPIKCVIPKTKKWNDPARLLPFSNSLIVCAGDFVGYEMAQIKNTEVLQLIVELDNIEYLAKPQADQASPLSPNGTSLQDTDPILAKSRYRRKSCRLTPASPTPSSKVLGKRPQSVIGVEDEDNQHGQQSDENEPPLKRNLPNGADI